MIPGSANTLLAYKAAGVSAYQIQRSLRFNSADSAYLSRTFGTATTQDTFTWAGWVKLGTLGTTRHLFGVSTNHSFGFTTGDALNLTFAGSSALTTTALFRDPSAWYHIAWKQSGTSHTIYVNNVSVGTATATSSVFNTAVAHQLGAANTANYFNGYLADIHFIDGQALDPTSFGEFDTNGIWQPKAYTGSYGTNGFKLDFSDNSNNTATTLGKDASGNGNNFTPTNLSVTAGSGNDSLVDSPTNYGTDTGTGGEVRGNYATFNPLNMGSNLTLSNGNLQVTSSGNGRVSTTIALPDGQYTYAECTVVTAGAGSSFGIGTTETTVGDGSYIFKRFDSGSHNGVINGTTISGENTFTLAADDILGVAYDPITPKLTFYKNGVSSWSLNLINLTGKTLYFAYRSSTGSAEMYINTGQRPFAYTAPSGFEALCTVNLPTPSITKGSDYFDTVLYTGTGAALTPTSSLGFSPDLVWIKSRSAATDNTLYDIVRGAEARLESNATDAQVTSDGGLTAFNSSGFTLGTLAQVNTNTATYAAWTWDGGSSTVTNTSGTISSQVRANVTAGFSIVSYTGNSTSGATVGHGLGVVPSLVVVKNAGGAGVGWRVFHAALGGSSYLVLNNTNASTSNADAWNNTAPSSTLITLGSSTNSNGSSAMIAYCFAPVSGYSAFGSYTGNGNENGPFVYLGFRPAFVLVKMSSSTGNWTILDSKREGYNVDNDPLYTNLTGAEGTTDLIDITSNGFKVRTTDATFNTNTGTYVYAAWAENPFSLARAR